MPTDDEVIAAAIAVRDTFRGIGPYSYNAARAALAAAEAVRVQADECHALDRNHVGLCQCSHCRAFRAGVDHAKLGAPSTDKRHLYGQTAEVHQLGCQCESCRYQGRMTQTHAPLASYVEWSLPGDPASYDPIAKVWHPAVMAALSEAACGCWRCMRERNDTVGMSRFVVCRTCGNKRCPHANDHDYYCTGSNDPGQPGSAYPATSVQQPPPSQVAPTPANSDTCRHGKAWMLCSLCKDCECDDLKQAYLMLCRRAAAEAVIVQTTLTPGHTSAIPGDGVGITDVIETETEAERIARIRRYTKP